MGRKPLPGRLRAIPAINANIEELHEDDDALIRLHEIMFGVTGSRSVRKKNVLAWSSREVEDSPKKIETLRAAISGTPLLTVLKEICVMLDLNVPMGRPAIEAAIFEFLSNVPELDGSASSKKVKAKPAPVQEPIIKDAPTIETSPELTMTDTNQTPKDEEMTENELMDTSQATTPDDSEGEDVPPPAIVRKKIRRGGRKKGSRNKTPEEKEALRLALLIKPKGRPGRKKGSKNSPKMARPKPESPGRESQRRGRPLNFNEMRAFRAFVKNNFPDVFQKWAQMPTSEQESYWVRHRYDI